MEFFKKTPNINFVGMIKINMGISMILWVASLAYIFGVGLNYGVDFQGGTVMELYFKNDVAIGDVRSALSSKDFGESEIKYVGSHREVIVSTEMSTGTLEGMEKLLEEALSAKFPAGSYSIERVEMVGPKVGADLQKKAVWAVVLSWVLMLVYIAFRFEFKFGLGAILSLVHDSVICVALFSITGHKFNMPTLAAVLTLIGYSINDTIIIFDRIREDLKKVTKKTLEEIINLAINETLSRTILTSAATLLSVVGLYIFGADTIKDFAFMMIIGIVFGTYSSIYVAAPVVLFWKGKGTSLK
jgi:preprotein translocase subunit SecF